MSAEEVITRRQALSRMGKIGIAAAVVVAAGGTGIAAYEYLQPKGNVPATLNGLYYWPGPAGSSLLSQLKSEDNITLNPTFAASIGATIGDALASSGQQYQLINFFDGFSSALIGASPAIFQPIPVNQISKWSEVAALFTNPSSVLGSTFGAQNDADMWFPGQSGSALAMFPSYFGHDSMGFNPQYVTTDMTSWGDLVNRQWAGKVSLQNIPTDSVNIWGLYLAKSGQMAQPGTIDNLTNSEVDAVVNYLIQQKKAGQFTTLWSTVGDGINLMTSGSVWAMDNWTNMTIAARHANIPWSYIKPTEGLAYWFGGEGVTKNASSSDLSAAINLFNFRLSGWSAVYYANAGGYGIPSYPSQEVQSAMGPEYYDWTYNGKATYKSISSIFPSQSSRIGQALFDPTNYTWSTTSGTPDPNGNARFQGSIDDRITATGTVETYPGNGSYYTTAWDNFTSA